MISAPTMRWLTIAALVMVGCGGTESPTSPTPLPSQPASGFTGTVTETLTGTPIAGFSASVTGARVIISAPGYITRETRADARSVDLIRESDIDLRFYRQFARGAIEGRLDSLRVLAQAPSIYLQANGLTPATIAALERAAREVIPALTGSRFSLSTWETGSEMRPDRAGWIIVETINDEAAQCGRTMLGATAGHMWLNVVERCRYDGLTIDPPLFAHELGHALGFWHVDAPGHIMKPRETFAERRSTLPSDTERRHAAIAYARTTGNRDVDIDQ